MAKKPGFAMDTAMARSPSRKGKTAIKKPGFKPKVATAGQGRKPC